MEIQIITNKISLNEIKQAGEATFGDMVKAVVDVEKRVMAMGGEWHADAEAVLLENGSEQKNLWGINLFPENEAEDFIAFKSLINIRPRANNRTMELEDTELRKTIEQIVRGLIR